MFQEYKFDKTRDRGVVIEGLAPDLNKMIETGIVPDCGTDVVYNQLENIEDIGCRVSDVFQAMVMQKQMLSSLNNESTPKGENE